MTVAGLFLISALRAIVEMLGLCLLGQGVLYLLAGRSRATHPVYQLFALITEIPRQVVAAGLPRSSGPVAIGLCSFGIVLLFWLGLAYLRKSI